MNLREKIETDYKNALKSKDKNKISTYRLILAGVKDLDIQNRSGPQKKETDDEDTKKICEDIISKLGASSIKDMGKVMSELKKQHAEEIDFAKAGTFLKQLLNK